MYQDKTIVCSECGNEFVFSASEQEFYAQKGFANEPKKCKDCRVAAKRAHQRGPKKMYDVVCSQCGAEAQVPFQPKGDKPVLCNDCYKASRS